MSNAILSPRFCIAEQHGLQEPKYRVIDGLSRPEVNATSHMTDTYFPQDMGALVSQVRDLSHVGAVDLRDWPVGFPIAYKTIESHEPSDEAVAVCFANPDGNLPYKAQISAQPFGRRRAPSNWGRVVTFIQFLAREILSLTVSAFPGDVYAAEPASAATGGFWPPKRLDRLIGFITPDKKGRPPTTSLLLLGAPVAIGTSSSRAAERPGRVGKIRGHIAQALQTNTLTPAAASKLRRGWDFTPPPPPY